jgi:hypothetical protein
MLAEFTSWLVGLVTKFFSALWSFVVDAFVNAVEMVANAVVGLLSLIPVPEFMHQGLQTLYAQLDPGIAYLVSAAGLPTALGIIGTGYAFRLVRKVATLFQW